MTYKFSEMADKIREIEVGGNNNYILQVELQEKQSRFFADIRLGSSSGNTDILYASENDYTKVDGTTYTWEFNTNLTDIYMSVALMSRNSNFPMDSGEYILVKNLKAHKGIKFYVERNSIVTSESYQFID